MTLMNKSNSNGSLISPEVQQQLASYIGNASNINNADTFVSTFAPCPLSMRRVAMDLNDEACKLSEEGK